MSIPSDPRPQEKIVVSVFDTIRMDLTDPKWQEYILDRRQAQAIVAEVDSLRNAVKDGQHKADLAVVAEVDRLQNAVHELESMVSDEESRANEMARTLHEVRGQRAQLLAQLEQLCDSAAAEVGAPIEARDLHGVMSETREMIAKMKTT